MPELIWDIQVEHLDGVYGRLGGDDVVFVVHGSCMRIQVSKKQHQHH